MIPNSSLCISSMGGWRGNRLNSAIRARVRELKTRHWIMKKPALNASRFVATLLFVNAACAPIEKVFAQDAQPHAVPEQSGAVQNGSGQTNIAGQVGQANSNQSR